MTVAVVLAADFRAIGITVAALVLVAFVALFIRNIRVSRPELGSEIELAPNRKPYMSDEELEGTKLDHSLSFALVMLVILAIALPFYWLAEPGRQDGAIDAYNLSFEVQGEGLYVEGAQCVNCHSAGGVGGSREVVFQDADGQFISNANWKAPSLDTVLLRYSEDEVRYVLNFGRPGSPMAAWGTPGGGPLTTQQVDNLVIYLRTLQQQSIDPVVINQVGTDEEVAVARDAADGITADVRAEVDRSIEAGEFETVGEAVFNLGVFSGYKGGGLSCARCHTAGWSLGLDAVADILDEGVAGCGGGDPSGIGFNLCSGSVKNHFPDDTWKAADGSWLPTEGLADDQGFFIEAADGSPVRLSDGGLPETDDGRAYLILDEATNPGQGGDLADCNYISQLYQPQIGDAYPFAAEFELVRDENDALIEPPLLTPEEVPGEALALADGRLVGECTFVEMPERTSQAHFDFIFSGATAGSGYGRGGQSHAGMMPGFGGVLPPELIQAVVDYERGL